MSEHFEAMQEIPIEKDSKQVDIRQHSKVNVLELLKKETEIKIQKYKETIKKLEEELKAKEEEIKNLTDIRKNLEEELGSKKQHIENIEKEKEALIEECNQLKSLIEQLKEHEAKEESYKNAVINSLESIASYINQKKQLALDEIKTIISTVLDNLYMKCNIDIESVIKDILENSNIFKEFIILKANKTFIETFKKYVNHIENVKVEFVEEDFEDGEFQLETKDFILERSNKELLKDAIEKTLQNIR